MKTLKTFSTLLLLVAPLMLFSQNNLKEAHQKLTETHKLIIQKNQSLNQGKVKDVKKYSEEMGTLIASMKTQFNEIERKHTPKIKESIKMETEAIKKFHQSAEARYNQLKEEAMKPAPNVNKIKEYSKLMTSQITEAEKQNNGMLKKEGTIK